jgi:hypothetical protein
MIKILATATIMALFLGLSAATSLKARPRWNCDQYEIIKNKNGGFGLDVLCVYSKDNSSKRVFLDDVQNCKNAPAFMKKAKSCKVNQDSITIKCNKDDEILARKIVRFKSPNEKQKIAAGLVCS